MNKSLYLLVLSINATVPYEERMTVRAKNAKHALILVANLLARRDIEDAVLSMRLEELPAGEPLGWEEG